MLKAIGTLHRLLYRCSGGRMGTMLRGDPVLLLTTTGRRSGQERTWPICYLRAGDELVLVASGAGAMRHPAWYLNLQANPRVSVQIGEMANLRAFLLGRSLPESPYQGHRMPDDYEGAP